jgi:hypothetical protein
MEIDALTNVFTLFYVGTFYYKTKLVDSGTLEE